MEDKLCFEYTVPIDNRVSESTSTGKNLIIAGTAIRETTSRNGRTYVAEELQPVGEQLTGKKLLKDHNNSVDSIAGKVKESYYDPVEKSIKFKATVTDEKMQRLIREGVLDTVSIGASAESIEEIEQDGDTLSIVRGLNLMELSLVAVEGVPQATFGMVAEKLSLKEEKKVDIQKEESLEEDKKMTEEKKVSVEPIEAKEEVKVDHTSEKLDKLASLMEVMITKMTVKEEEEPAAEPEAEPEEKPEAKVEEEPETKAEVGEPEEDKAEESFIVEKNKWTGNRTAITLNWENPEMSKKLGYEVE